MGDAVLITTHSKMEHLVNVTRMQMPRGKAPVAPHPGGVEILMHIANALQMVTASVA